ncbi:MAG: penicillin-binding protein 1A [Pseudomonadota bacterium]
MRLIGGLFALATYGLFAGVLAIAGLFWWHSSGLPSTAQLKTYEPPVISRVHSGDGKLLAEFARERRLFTPIDEIPDLVKSAFISAEDKNFYEHQGIDGLGLVKAMIDNVMRYQRGQRLRGASTITQQVVKTFLLSGERAVTRKIREAILAKRLEEAFSKDRILELYLNQIFLGARAYGVTAAADLYFDKKMQDLAPHEAAYLAALPKAPSDYHPVRQKERATARRDYVLREMRENGYLTDQEYEAAVAEPLVTVLDQPAEERADKTPDLDYFSEEIRRELIEELGEDKVYGGGLSIRATVDPDLQRLARRVLQQRLWEYSVENRGYLGPIASIKELAEGQPVDWRDALRTVRIPRDVEPWRPAVVLSVGKSGATIGVEGVDGDKHTLAFSDVKDWAKERKGYNRDGVLSLGALPKGPADVWSTGDVIYVEEVAEEGAKPRWSMRQIPEVNGALVAIDPHTGRVLAMQGGFSHQSSVFNRATQAARQPGSAFKPFVYAAALENGYKPNSIVLDAPVSLPQVQGEVWKPKNYSGKFYGPSPLRWGLEKSQNLMTVRIAMDVGLEQVAGYAQRFGVYDDMPPLVSYALGAGETTLMKLTASYAMFVNGGKLIEPTLIDRIQDRHGGTVFRHDDRICAECRAETWANQAEPFVPDEGVQVLDPVTAYQVVSMLEGVAIRGTASSLGKNLDFPVAGKTGTTNEARDAWFVGFTPDLAVGCFVGFDNPRTLGARMSGGRLCAPVFQRFMAGAMKDRPKFDFRKPSGVTLAKVNRRNGCRVSDGAEGDQFIWEAFRNDSVPPVGACADGFVGGYESQTGDAFSEVGDEGDGLGGAATGSAAGGPRLPPRPPRGAPSLGTIY